MAYYLGIALKPEWESGYQVTAYFFQVTVRIVQIAALEQTHGQGYQNRLQEQVVPDVPGLNSLPARHYARVGESCLPAQRREKTEIAE